MSRYDYPRLPRAEIIGVLAESQIAHVSEADIINPKSDVVANLYTGILLHLDLLQEDYSQVDFAALEQFENPDQHVDSVRIMNLFHKIRGILAAVGCPKQFTFKDFIKPEPDRTELFLSAILNFCLYRDAKMTLLGPVVNDFGVISEQRQALEVRMSQLNEEMSEINAYREGEMPLVQEIDSKVKELRQSISALNSHQMSLKTEIRKLKEKVKEKDEEISSAEFALVESAHVNANLRSEIVQSPDKLQGALEEKRSLLLEAKNAEKAARQSFHDKSATLELYTKAAKKMSKHLAEMKSIQEQVNSTKSIEKDAKVLKTKLSDEGVLLKSLEAKLVERQGKADQLDELKKQLERERDMKYQEAAKELNNVRFEVEAKRRELESRQRNAEALLAEVDAITSKINSVKGSGAAKRQLLEQKCEETVEEFYRYSSSIRDSLLQNEVG